MAKKRVLFRLPHNGWRSPGRVMLNWSNDPIKDLEWIAETYQKVAHDRVEALAAQRRGLRGGDEFEAYPIVFLYRQAFELNLKAIVFAGAVALREEGEEPMPLEKIMKHDLTPLFEEMVRVFGVMGADDAGIWDFGVDELKTKKDFAGIVREFDAVDRGSYTFRYSIKTDGKTPSLERGFEFDLFVFAAIMDRILPVLSAAPEWIRESLQERWEAAYEAQQEAWANADDYDASDHEPPDYEPGDYEPGDYQPGDYEPGDYEPGNY